MTKQILIVEDEPGLQALLKTELTFETYDVLQATDGETALQQFQTHQDTLNLIILDWMIPKIDGLGVLRRIRKIDTQLPIIFLTARDFSGNRVAGLDSGADDYVIKPFDMEELLARIRVMFRHQAQTNPTWEIAGLKLDAKAHQVSYQQQRVQLTQREFELLAVLVQHANQTLNRDEILDAAWGVDFVGQLYIVDVYIRQLRQKLAALNPTAFEIQTVRGVGYTFREVTL